MRFADLVEALTMDDDAIEREILRRERRRWPWVVLVLGLMLATGFGIFRYTLHRRLVTELVRLRAAGYPTTLAELDAWYPTPGGANAADVYLEAFGAYFEDEELEALLPGLGREVDWPEPHEPLPAEMLAAMEAYLADNAMALELLAEAAAMRECRYPVNMNAGIQVLLPHLQELRRGAQLLTLQAVLQARRNQNDRSVDSVLAILAAARSLDNEPIMISYLVQAGVTQQARAAAEQILGRTALTDSQLSRLSQAFAGAIGRKALPRIMAGERAWMLGDFEALMSSRARAVFGRVTGLSDAERSAYLRIMEQVIKRAEDPSGQFLDTDAMIRDLPRSFTVVRNAAPAVNPVIKVDLQTDAALQTLVVGLAAKRYQLALGKLPTYLDDLVPAYLDAVPMDPCDGEPLRYRRTDAGMKVYSVGPDRFDDDGREEPVQGRRHPDGTDIVFTLRR